MNRGKEYLQSKIESHPDVALTEITASHLDIELLSKDISGFFSTLPDSLRKALIFNAVEITSDNPKIQLWYVSGQVTQINLNTKPLYQVYNELLKLQEIIRTHTTYIPKTNQSTTNATKTGRFRFSRRGDTLFVKIPYIKNQYHQAGHFEVLLESTGITQITTIDNETYIEYAFSTSSLNSTEHTDPNSYDHRAIGARSIPLNCPHCGNDTVVFTNSETIFIDIFICKTCHYGWLLQRERQNAHDFSRGMNADSYKNTTFK